MSMISIGVSVVLLNLERLPEELECWLWEPRFGLDPKTKTKVVLEWKRCIALHSLEVQTMRTSRGLVGAPDI